MLVSKRSQAGLVGKRRLDRFKAIETFVTAAKAGSFAAAARQLRMSRAMVSRHVADLEQHLGIRLFYRTTREMSLTPTGAEYLNVCARVIEQLDDQEANISSLQSEPRGLLRVISVRSFGERLLAAAIADFVRIYPQLRIELELAPGTSTPVHLQNGYELGFSIAELQQSDAVVSKIATFDWVLCATPGYIRDNGMPRTLEDLRRHRCLTNQHHHPTGIWTFRRGNDRVSQPVNVALSLSSHWSMREATMNGAGISLLPSFCVQDDLRGGQLVRVLTDYKMDQGAIWSLYPHFAFVPAKVRLFTDFVRKRFSGMLDLDEH
jgi:DNA-binding transcriptional LysR family regulator